METLKISDKENIVLGLISDALSKIDRKYGTGGGDGEIPKFSHNFVHTWDVLSASRQISALAVINGKIEASDVPLVEIAASYHDIEQDLGPGKNEIESTKIAETEMKKAGIFSAAEIEKVKRMIMATTVYFAGGVLKQSASDEYLTQIIADADLSSLGQKPQIYWSRAYNLLREMKKTSDLPPEEILVFAEQEILFLKNHNFYTDEAKSLFTHKPGNLRFLNQYINKLKNPDYQR